MADDAVRESVTVPALPARAFDTFVNGFGSWWPTEYTWAQSDLDSIFIEPRVDGRCIERHRNGGETVWGTVLAVDPPERLAMAWQITPSREIEPDPTRAGVVEVRFAADGGGSTRVDLTHRDFARYGTGWQDYLSAMASPQGWAYCLDKYVAVFG